VRSRETGVRPPGLRTSGAESGPGFFTLNETV
jgi:hypothetical protein